MNILTYNMHWLAKAVFSGAVALLAVIGIYYVVLICKRFQLFTRLSAALFYIGNDVDEMYRYGWEK